MLHREFEGETLPLHHGVAQVVAGRGCGSGRFGRDPAAAGPAHVLLDPPVDEFFVHDAQPAVQADPVEAAHPGVADARHDRRGRVQGSQPPLRGVQVVALELAADHELVQGLLRGDQVADRRIAPLDPQVAGVEPVGLHGDERL